MWIKRSCTEPRHHQRDKSLWGLYHDRRGWSASNIGGGRAPRGMPSESMHPVTCLRAAPGRASDRPRGGPRRCGHDLPPWGRGRPARSWCLLMGTWHRTRWVMMSPQAVPPGGPCGSPPALAEAAAGCVPAVHGRSAGIGSCRCRSAAASTQRRWVPPVGTDGAAGPASADTGARRVPYTGWPGSPHAAGAGSRGAQYAAENAG